ncbi:hypothetical protein QJQ45_001460 [Haematococcus lacustris]|nr:hypothetical protein QJQ45_001460 [Haematococcus lacustris]
MSQPELLEMKKQVAAFLEQGIIEPSSSPYAAPVLFVKKKSEQLLAAYAADGDFASTVDQYDQDKHGLYRTKGKNQTVVPNCQQLKARILVEMHDAQFAGHVGITKTLERISRIFWWPRMRSEVRHYSDGQTERYNRTLEEMLRHYISPAQSDWPFFLALAEFAVNNSWQESIQSTPFLVNTGQSPLTPALLELPVEVYCPSARKLSEWWQSNVKQARHFMEQAQQRQAYLANKGRRDVEYHPGQLVLLSTKNLRLKPGKAKKLLPRGRARGRAVQADDGDSWFSVAMVVRVVLYSLTAILGFTTGMTLAVLYLVLSVLAAVLHPWYGYAFPSAHAQQPLFTSRLVPYQASSHALLHFHPTPDNEAVATPLWGKARQTGRAGSSRGPVATQHSTSQGGPPSGAAQLRHGSSSHLSREGSCGGGNGSNASGGSGMVGGAAGGGGGVEGRSGGVRARSKALAHDLAIRGEAMAYEWAAKGETKAHDWAARGEALANRMSSRITGAGEQVVHALGGRQRHSEEAECRSVDATPGIIPSFSSKPAWAPSGDRQATTPTVTTTLATNTASASPTTAGDVGPAVPRGLSQPVVNTQQQQEAHQPAPAPAPGPPTSGSQGFRSGVRLALHAAAHPRTAVRTALASMHTTTASPTPLPPALQPEAAGQGKVGRQAKVAAEKLGGLGGGRAEAEAQQLQYPGVPTAALRLEVGQKLASMVAKNSSSSQGQDPMLTGKPAGAPATP